MLLSSSSSSFLPSRVNNPAKRGGGRGRTRIEINDLPEEILQQILIRVPAKFVLRCGSVCRMWKALTSTQYFGELHHHRNPCSSDDFTLLVEEMLRPGKRIGMRMVETYFKLEKELYIFDDWRGENRIISPRPDYSCIDAYEDEDNEDEAPMFISGSYSGLVVLHHKPKPFIEYDKIFSRNLIIMNPIFPDNKLKIKVAESSKIRGQIFGVFLHPVLKEFCVLWGQTRESLDDDYKSVVEGYKLLNLGPSQSRWRNINNGTVDDLLKKRQQPRIEICNWGTLGVTSPIVLDDVLYWMADERPVLVWSNPKFCEEAIIGFDTKTEEFHLLPHPAPCNCCCYKNVDKIILKDDFHKLVRARLLQYFRKSMHLLQNNNGHLSLCEFSKIDAEWLITIWIFKKREEIQILPSYAASAKGSWIKVHTIKLNDEHIILSTQTQLDFRNSFIPIGMIDEELLLVRCQCLGYLFVCNLKLGTCERFESKRGIIDDDDTSGTREECTTTFISAHNHTLIPIRNSNPEIILWEEEEEEE